MLSKKLISYCVAIIFAGISHAAHADTTGKLTVNATVMSGCTVGSTGAINLMYDPMNSAPTTANTAGSLMITCSGGTVWGVYSDQSVATRIMSYVGTQTLAGTMYSLPYTLWNDVGVGLAVTNTTGQATGIGIGAPQPIHISAMVAPKLNVAVGQYTQTINLVVVY